MVETNRIDFPGADGQSLAARLDLPDGEVRATALFAHCFSCSKDILAAKRIAETLVGQGYAVMRFDFTGLGHSEGDFANTNFSTNVQDLVAAANWLNQHHSGPDLLIGHSLGGAAVVVAAHQISAVKAVATIGAPADADHVLHQFGTGLDAIETAGVAEVSLAGRPFTMKRQFVEDVRGQNVREAAASLGRPLLVLHAPLDQTVGIDNATGLFVSAKHPKSFISLDKADHLLTKKADAIYAASTIATWAGRYVDPSPQVVPVKPSPGAHDMTVTETGGGRFENVITVGTHTFLADEPAHAGGGGKGPDPYDLVTAGLGACTAMTLRIYADRKGWPLEKVSVALRHGKDYAEDCAHCEEDRKVDIFTREITLVGALDGAQRDRLLEMADRCPVHRTLHEAVHVRTSLVDDTAPA
ncbi:MAG: bifunctional alpha/beta hydrolase/OsmC family protein [Pseudomonadota bacterium]